MKSCMIRVHPKTLKLLKRIAKVRQEKAEARFPGQPISLPLGALLVVLALDEAERLKLAI